jgi:hypothetical protein
VCECNAPEAGRAVPDYEGFYEVSTCGQVRSVDRVITDRAGRVMRWRGKLLAQSPSSDGRLKVTLSIGGVVSTRKVHHLVLETFTGPCPENMEGCHGNGDHTDNHWANLRWDTHSANELDAVRHGTHNETRKAACPLEHLLTAPNLVPRRLPSRICLSCQRARAACNNARRRKGLILDLRTVASEHYARIMSATA